MDEKSAKLLEDIKWLLVLHLEHRGVASKDIARVLDVDPAAISRRVPRSK